MTKQKINITLIFLFVYLAAMVAIFSSCTSIKKLRTNVKTEVVKTEIVQKSEVKDSTSKTITKTIDSSGITVTVVYDSTSTDTATTFDITTYPPSADQYTERISIKSSIKPKSITVNQAKKKQAERLDSVVSKKEHTENIKKDEKVVTKVKTVDKKKVVFKMTADFTVEEIERLYELEQKIQDTKTDSVTRWSYLVEQVRLAISRFQPEITTEFLKKNLTPLQISQIVLFMQEHSFKIKGSEEDGSKKNPSKS